MDDKDNEQQSQKSDYKETNSIYKSAIDMIANINNKANILSAQTSFLSKGILGKSLNKSFLDINRQYSKIDTIYKCLPEISKMKNESSVLFAARAANLSISQLAGTSSILAMSKVMQASSSYFAIQRSFAELANPLSSFLKHENNIATLASIATIDKSSRTVFAASCNIGKIAEYALQAEKNYSRFNLADIGSRIGIEDKLRPRISDTIIAYSKSFSELWKSYETAPSTFNELSSTLVRIPPIEYFNTSSFIEKISSDENDDADEELLKSDLLIENEETLMTLLPKLNPELLNLWLGAKQALESGNKDKVRHFTTSIRELVTQVLHSLSPDQDLIKWTTNPTEHIQNNKPTRKARLLYIYRDVNNDHFKSFIETDIKATLQFIDLFQEGTHAIKSQLTEKQLITIKIKTESTLKYLLQTYYETK